MAHAGWVAMAAGWIVVGAACSGGDDDGDAATGPAAAPAATTPGSTTRPTTSGPPSSSATRPPSNVDPADLGTIRGAVTWSGALPTVTPLPVTKNANICGAATKPSPRLMVDSANRAVRNTVVWLANMPRGFPKPPAKVLLNQERCQYEPHILIVPRGKYLYMTSSDAVLHNINAAGALRFNKPFPNPGIEIKAKARKAGMAELNCDAGHSWMSAFVFVTEHPFYAVTGADGRFALRGVPPGEHTLHVWHEGWTVTRTDTEPSGAVKKYHFDAPKTLQVPFTLAKKGTATVDVALSPTGLARK